MKYRNWQIPYTAPQPPEALLRAGYSPLRAVLLALRGYADPVQARAFLSGGDQCAFDPMLLQDMDKAVARIRTAIERRENVAVFGDYDVDGITSTCVLTDYLRRQGVPVHPYIPDRIEEGYGLNMDAITNLQRTSDITLIITVDCGITAIDETNYALQRGIDEYGLDAMREMARDWPFFAAMTDDVEMLLAKSDLGIFERYSQLAGDLHEAMYPGIAEEFLRSRDAILAIKDAPQMLDGDYRLRLSIRLRNPYVDPISLLQVDLLCRWREGGREDEALLEALVTTVNGIAAGIQNTG